MTRIAGLFGVVGALMGFGFPIYFAAMDPRYDQARNYISELGATGAPNGELVNMYGFLPTGIAIVLFAVLAWASLPRSWAAFLGLLGLFFFALGYVGAAFFPCDAGCRPAAMSFNQWMHDLSGLPAYFFAPLYMACLAIAARRWPGGEWLSPLAGSATVTTAAGLVMFLPDSPLSGFWQRVLEAGVLIWIAACGAYFLAGGPSAMRARNDKIPSPSSRS